jgi:MFS family permease
VIWGLATMTLEAKRHVPSEKTMWRDLSDGAGYARRHTVIFRILILSTAVCLVACPFMAIIPIFAFKVLGGNDLTVGWLNAMQGIGAVTGAVLFTGDRELGAVKRKLIADIIFWGLGLITLGLSRDLWLSLAAMFTLGYFMMSVFPTMNNAIQQLVDDRMRGRVMSLYMMTFLGSVPLGSLAMGWLAERFGAPRVVTGAGLLTLAIGLALVVRGLLRERARSWPAPVNLR